MKSAALAFAALLAAAGAAAAQERAGDTVPFELKSNLVFVKVAVNGTADLAFIFDTGASVTVLKPDTAKKLGLLAKGEKAGGLLGGATFKIVDTLGAGNAVVRDLPVAVMGVPQADLPLAAAGISYDGILGYNYISRFVTTVDYKAKTIKLVPSDYEPEDPRRGVPAAAPAPDEAPAVHVGFSYATIGDDQANEIGVEGAIVVKAVAPDSPAAAAGLKKGDIITELNGKRIDRAEDYRKALAKARPGQVLSFNVIRDKKDVTVDVTAAERK
jgi:hypothetical protein